MPLKPFTYGQSIHDLFVWDFLECTTYFEVEHLSFPSSKEMSISKESVGVFKFYKSQNMDLRIPERVLKYGSE